MGKTKFITTLHLLVVVLFSIIVSCSDDKDSTLEGNGLKEQSWSSNWVYSISAGQTLSFTFNAYSSWTATNNSAAFLTLNTNSGNSGENTLEVTANDASQQQGTITIKVNGYPVETNINIKLSNSIQPEDGEVNYDVDGYLKKMYLWNDEYKTLKPDFTLAYDKFLENTLMSMTTNTLDKKKYVAGNGRTYYALFSFIQKLDPNLQSSTRGSIAKKELKYNFGFIDMLPVKDSPTGQTILFAVQGVYPGSSADQQGVKRGTQITRVNDQRLTESNWRKFYTMLCLPSAPMPMRIEDDHGESYLINSGPIYPNPIIRSQVKSESSHQIAYLAYSAFDAGFDQELFNVFTSFHNQSITDLVLDLRYNGGGNVISANLISTCIAGDACKGQTFVSYRYNDSRMKEEFGNQRPVDEFAYTKYENLHNISLAPGALNLKTVYCLVSNNTASASELVINSLKGIGIDVKLIGMTTHGKNVGMEGTMIRTAAANYQFYPITFQSYNAKGYSGYENGFQPDYSIDENAPNGSHEFYGYGDFGTTDDPLYAKAVSLITGINLSESTTRSINQKVGKPLAKPEIKRIGMIK